MKRNESTSGEKTPAPARMAKTDAEWREQLSPEEYRILRQKGTERAFTGKYWDTKTKGTYACAGCGHALYASETKFDSGTGWPSFWAPVDEAAIKTEPDGFFGSRTELLCSRCGGHLGHVFEDGPPPTGQRHCINSVSLKLLEGGETGAKPGEKVPGPRVPEEKPKN